MDRQFILSVVPNRSLETQNQQQAKALHAQGKKLEALEIKQTRLVQLLQGVLSRP
jgi:hypothetical protein